MVSLVVGLVGGGKTYYCLNKMLEHIASGGVVVTNIKLNIQPFFNESEIYLSVCPDVFLIDDKKYNSKGLILTLKHRYNWNYQTGQYLYLNDSKLMSDNLVDYLPAGTSNKHVLFIVDESADFFHSRNWQKANEDFLSFLRHVRKVHIDVLFIVQVYGQINKSIRDACESIFHCRDISKVKVLGFGYFFKSIPYLGNCIRVLEFSPLEFGRVRGRPCSRLWVKKDINIFSCYNTEALHNAKLNLLKIKTNFSDVGKISKINKYKIYLFILFKSFIYAFAVYSIMELFL
jgi:hypothetical protein